MLQHYFTLLQNCLKRPRQNLFKSSRCLKIGSKLPQHFFRLPQKYLKRAYQNLFKTSRCFKTGTTLLHINKVFKEFDVKIVKLLQDYFNNKLKDYIKKK